MAVIPQIAWQVFRESVRDKVLYNLVLFAVVLIAASYLIGQLSAGQDVKIIKDLGLGATQVFGGIAYTWEHQAHVHLRRAATRVTMLGSRSAHRAVVSDWLRTRSR